MALGEFIKDARERRKLSQRELAILAGVSIATVRNIEQGTARNLQLETAGRLARTLRVSIDRIYEEMVREGQMEPALA